MQSQLREVVAARQLARSGAARVLRESRGLSLADLAKAVGVSAVTVLRWERGENSPRSEHASRYGRILEELRKP